MTYPVNNGRGPAGPQGADGQDGSDGVGVSSSMVTYQSSPSGTTIPSGSWSSSMPAASSGSFLWSRTQINFTDSSSQTVYSSAYQGSDGAQGIPGTPGSPGNNGDPGTNGTNGANGISYNPQTPVVRTLTIGTAFQHTDTTKPFKAVVNVRATQKLTVAGLSADKLELRAGPNSESVAAGGAGGFSVGVWESGITGVALMVGAGIQDGGSMFADVPAGWYFQVNRISGSSATIVSAFTQSLVA